MKRKEQHLAFKENKKKNSGKTNKHSVCWKSPDFISTNVKKQKKMTDRVQVLCALPDAGWWPGSCKQSESHRL